MIPPDFSGDRRIVRAKIGPDAAGRTLLDYLAYRFSYRSESEWSGELCVGRLALNGATANGTELLSAGMELEYFPPEFPEPEVDFSCPVLYEDEFLLAVNKSGNLPVHPAGPYFKHTLWYELRRKYRREFFLFHRLDRETSGVLLLGKSSETVRRLNQPRTALRKEYLALVFGEFPVTPVIADGRLERDTSSQIRKKQRFVPAPPLPETASKAARTVFTAELRGELPDGRRISLIRAVPETGRFHQIRSTLCSLGFPLLGDKLYGPDENFYLTQREDALSAEDREKLVLVHQALHAEKLEFLHPFTGKKLEIHAPLPAEWEKWLPEKNSLEAKNGNENTALH